jgi:hypothetical protein
MNLNGMAELLSGILESQVESGQYGSIDEERIRESRTTGPKLSEAEQSLLLLSPVARSDYRRVCRRIQEELTSRLLDQGVEMELLPLAAATDEDKVVMHGNGFNVTLYKRNDLGIPWVILVQLQTSYLRALDPMTILRLVDSGGLEWLRGKPDVNGEVTATWDDPETDILARSRRFSLKLEPV